MAKKKGKQTPKSNPKKAHEETAGQKAAARVRASAPPVGTGDEGADEAPPAATAPPHHASRERDPRIPPVGTVIIKKDRQGKERARCTIVEGGVEYAGTIYRSLSGAGLQASKNLGNQTTTCDGLAFWSLKKVARSASTKDAAEALDKAWARYRDRAATAAKVEGDEQRAKAKAAIREHATALLALAGEA